MGAPDRLRALTAWRWWLLALLAAAGMSASAAGATAARMSSPAYSGADNRAQALAVPADLTAARRGGEAATPANGDTDAVAPPASSNLPPAGVAAHVARPAITPVPARPRFARGRDPPAA